MNVTCPNCATVFRVDPAKVPEAGVRARCSVCSAVFGVHREGRDAQPALAAPTAVSAAPAALSAPSAPPAAPSPASRPAASPSPRPAPPAAAPSVAPRAEPTRSEPPRPAAPGGAPRPPAVAGGPAMPGSVAASAPPAAPAPPSPSPIPAHTAPAPTRPAGPVAGRPVNPFLSQDPAQKARRLARALVSDIVVYHPAKRQEGLRDGTLKELFEDEIRKSYEEYTEQVGRDLAESTGYFREALNEILAGGRQLF
jgi:predicted Zn finger-like uncharacterized protein